MSPTQKKVLEKVALVSPSESHFDYAPVQSLFLEKWIVWAIQPSRFRSHKIKGSSLYESYKFYVSIFGGQREGGVLLEPCTMRKFYNLLRDVIASDYSEDGQPRHWMEFRKRREGWFVEGAVINPEVEEPSLFIQFLAVDQKRMSDLCLPSPRVYTEWLKSVAPKVCETIKNDTRMCPPHWAECFRRLYSHAKPTLTLQLPTQAKED